MKTKKAMFFFAAVAFVATGATALYLNLNDHHDGREEGSMRPLAQASDRADRKDANPAFTQLVSQAKVSPSNIEPELGRAFSIKRSGPMRPSGDALKYAQGLLASSENGNAAATYDIFLAKLDCDNALKNSGTSYQEIKTNAAIEFADSRKEQQQTLTECEGLLTSSEFQDRNWLQKAAAQGSIEAMLMYSINPDHILGNPSVYAMQPELVQRWKDDSIQYLKTAASLGSTDALYRLSNAYQDGIVAESDPVKAAAYHIAAMKSMKSPPPQWSQPESKLTSEQNLEAQRQSIAILKSCCSN